MIVLLVVMSCTSFVTSEVELALSRFVDVHVTSYLSDFLIEFSLYSFIFFMIFFSHFIADLNVLPCLLRMFDDSRCESFGLEAHLSKCV